MSSSSVRSEKGLFNVEVCPVYEVQVPDVRATTPMEAARVAAKACQTWLPRSLQGAQRGQVVEFQGSFSHYLVEPHDLTGPYTAYHIHDGAEILLDRLQGFVDWFDAGQDPTRLNDLIGKAREELGYRT